MEKYEVLEICLNAPDEAALDGEWVNFILFDGVGFGITDALNCVKLDYPTLKELTPEMLDKIALHRFGSMNWALNPGGNPEFGDSAVVFGKPYIISAGRYSRDLTNTMLNANMIHV